MAINHSDAQMMRVSAYALELEMMVSQLQVEVEGLRDELKEAKITIGKLLNAEEAPASPEAK